MRDKFHPSMLINQPENKEKQLYPQALESNKNYLFDLNDLSCLMVDGAKAREFLQGQVSCDLNQITPTQMRRGCLCNLKGRIVALLDIFSWNNFKIILPQSLVSFLQKDLQLAAKFSQISFKEATDVAIYGLYYCNESDILPPFFKALTQTYAFSSDTDYAYYHLGQGFYILIVNASIHTAIKSTFSQHQQLASSVTWHFLRLQEKEIQIYPETQGLFLPHRLGLHNRGYIDFNKGCYRGQEIIARTEYLAKLKHELKICPIQTAKQLIKGQKIFSPVTHNDVGELVDYCPLGKEKYLIAGSFLSEIALDNSYFA